MKATGPGTPVARTEFPTDTEKPFIYLGYSGNNSDGLHRL
jgi:hypothetical protein